MASADFLPIVVTALEGWRDLTGGERVIFHPHVATAFTSIISVWLLGLQGILPSYPLCSPEAVRVHCSGLCSSLLSVTAFYYSHLAIALALTHHWGEFRTFTL